MKNPSRFQLSFDIFTLFPLLFRSDKCENREAVLSAVVSLEPLAEVTQRKGFDDN